MHQNYMHFKGFQTEVLVLSVNETKITAEKAFNQDRLEIEGNHGSDNDVKHSNILTTQWVNLV